MKGREGGEIQGFRVNYIVWQKAIASQHLLRLVSLFNNRDTQLITY